MLSTRCCIIDVLIGPSDGCPTMQHTGPRFFSAPHLLFFFSSFSTFLLNEPIESSLGRLIWERESPVGRMIISVMAATGDEATIGCNDCGCPNSLFEFHDSIKDRDFVIEFLRNHNLIGKEKECPKCKGLCSFDKWNLNWRCQKSHSVNKKRKRKCNVKLNALKGTFFCKSHLDLEVILKFCVIFMDKCFTIRFLERELKIT